MGHAKSAAVAEPAPAKSSPGGPKPRNRKLQGAVIGLLTIAAVSFGLWKWVEPHVRGGAHFKFAAAAIHITPPPPWVHGDVKAEALRQSSLDDRMSVLDPSLIERIAAAFTLHHWVAKVVRVTRLPGAGLDVELMYRRPVCMVEVPGGLYPIDENGVLLPTDGFSTDEALHYPRLAGIHTVTEGPVGTPWQDARVVEAAKVAAALVEDWDQLQLARIVPSPVAAATTDPEFELYTLHNTCIYWGHAQPSNPAIEPTAAEKAARLKQHADPAHGLDRPSPENIDLRRPAGIVVTPRGAGS